jgi:hypothetical protein
MDKLFLHPGFRLIYVGDDGIMSLIKPLYFPANIIGDGYRCISHLWGDATRWEDHGINGVTWGVDLREEKRDKLLEIFNHFKGYWWMDVFCTNQEDVNKPLSIMGDIYKNCSECICMLDIKIPDFLCQPEETWRNIRVIIKHAIDVAECKWSKRVWTLQEWLLSPDVFYTEETFEEHFAMIHPDDITDMFEEGTIIGFLWLILYAIKKPKSILSTITIFSERSFSDIVVHLMKSGRECKDPKDYYYGIAGIFGISLADGLSFREVEEEFLSSFRSIKDSRSFEIGRSFGEKDVYKQWKLSKRGRNAFLHLIFTYIL